MATLPTTANSTSAGFQPAFKYVGTSDRHACTLASIAIIASVSTFDTGLEILMQRSKTDQEGVGRTVFIPTAKGKTCPVKALKNWLELARINEGALFRAVSRHAQ
jgi:hypothetical protein